MASCEKPTNENVFLSLANGTIVGAVLLCYVDVTVPEYDFLSFPLELDSVQKWQQKASTKARRTHAGSRAYLDLADT